MIHTVMSIKEAKKFVATEGYSGIFWSLYPDKVDVLLYLHPELRNVQEQVLRFAYTRKYKREIEHTSSQIWTIIIREACEAGMQLEYLLRTYYGMRRDVVVAEVYPMIVRSWRIKKKMKRSGKPEWFSRKVERIIDEEQGAVFIFVPREYKEIAKRIVEELKKNARYIFEE